MTNLDKIIGDVIFISFVDLERFKDIGIKINSGHFLLTGYDQMGLWLKHPGIVIIHNEDETGNPLPVTEHKKENISADFIVTWDNVKTIMHYPDRKGFDFPSEFDKNIGFGLANEDKK